MNTSLDQHTASTVSRRRLQGVVVKAAMMKTIVVRVDRRIPHPKYGKYYTRSAKFKVHDERAAAKIGDVVEFEETRPISKDKRWRYLRTITAIGQPADRPTS
ncbi:30S ribosomal protein S17 [Candidatus Uhrbacteria bacterium]|nr:30S ribosomal protein S17 [Candidatus Uhrbacteria bacterium]